MYVWLVILVFLGFFAGLHSLFCGERKDYGDKEERQKSFFDVI
jgi:hypothetical protein